MVSVKECTEINLALEGNHEIKGIAKMTNITQGKYAISQTEDAKDSVIKAYNKALTAIREKYYQKDGDNFKMDKDGKLIVKDGLKVSDAEKEHEELLESDCGVILPKINVAWLEKIPEVTPYHLKLLKPVLTDSK